MSSASSKVTTDHNKIRRWAQARNGKPVAVKGTGDQDDVGIIRIDFPGYSGGSNFEAITWDEFFAKFDEAGLAFLYQERTAEGERSNFNKFIRRETAEEQKKKVA